MEFRLMRKLGLKIGADWSYPTPLHEWKLSRASISGSAAADSGSTPANATIVGTLYDDDCPVGVLSALCSEANGYLTLGASRMPASLDSPHSWSAWVRLSDLSVNSVNGSTPQTFYSDYKDATNGVRIEMNRGVGNGRFKVSIFKGSGNVYWLSNAAAWKGNNYEAHVGYTWSGSAFVFYVDGVPVSAASGAASDGKPDANYIMARSSSLGQIDGSMANVRIWDTALTPAQVLAVFKSDLQDGIKPVFGKPGVGMLRFQDNFYGSALHFGKWAPNWFGANNTIVTKSANSYENGAWDPAQISLANSEVRLTTIASPITVDRYYPNRTGGMTTLNRFQYYRGYIEAKLFMPSKDGALLDNWPAFWANGNHGTWPDGIENDIMEPLSGVPASHFHYGVGGSDVNDGHTHTDCKNNWRVIGCKVTDTRVEYFLDGVKVHEYVATIQNLAQWFVLNNAISVQDLYGGPPVIGSTFRADYIRYWELP
jgi:beta-glucanase (GH16 family)